jgi:hypothetical protein
MTNPDSVIDPKAKARLRAELDRGDDVARAEAARRAAELRKADEAALASRNRNRNGKNK